MREGIKQGVVHPKSITRDVAHSSGSCKVQKLKTVFLFTDHTHTIEFSKADQENLKRAYHDTIAKQLNPAVTRLVKFWKPTISRLVVIAPVSTLYRMALHGIKRVSKITRHNFTPEEIHALGLKEVARIQQQWDVLGHNSVTRVLKQLPFGSPLGLINSNLSTRIKKYSTRIAKSMRPRRGSCHLCFRCCRTAEVIVARQTRTEPLYRFPITTPAADDGSHPGVF